MTNATMTLISPPPTVGPGGDGVAGSPVAINVRCVIDRPTFMVQRLIDQLKLESTAVLYVKLIDYSAAPATLIRNAAVTVQQDQTPSAAVYWIDDAQPKTFGGLSHIQCLLRAG